MTHDEQRDGGRARPAWHRPEPLTTHPGRRPPFPPPVGGRGRRGSRGAGPAMAAIVLLVVAGVGLGNATTATSTWSTRAVPRVVEVDAGATDVVVTDAGDGQVRIDRLLGVFGPCGDAPVVRGDALVVDAACRRLFLGRGDASVRVAVRVRAGSGDVTVAAGPARVDVETASGDVELKDPTGEVSVTTRSGDVGGRSAGVGPLRVRSDSGDVDVRLRRGRAPVWVETGAGDVELDVPRDGYEVRATSASGRVDVGASTPGAPGKVEVRTGSGSVRVG